MLKSYELLLEARTRHHRKHPTHGTASHPGCHMMHHVMQQAAMGQQPALTEQTWPLCSIPSSAVLHKHNKQRQTG